jgi:hypothetical protein
MTRRRIPLPLLIFIGSPSFYGSWLDPSSLTPSIYYTIIIPPAFYIWDHLQISQKIALLFPSPLVGEGEGEGDRSINVHPHLNPPPSETVSQFAPGPSTGSGRTAKLLI